MTSLFIKLVLIVVILLFEFLTQLPDYIILELKESSLLLIVFEESTSLCQLSREIVGENVNLNLELLGNSIFDVFVDLTVLVQEPNDVGAALRHKGRLVWGTTRGHIFHSHQNLVDTGDVLLDLCYVVLQDSHLDTLSAPKALHDGTILVSNVFLNHILEGLYLIDSVVKSNDLRDKLSTLGYNTCVNGSVNQVETGTESFLHGRNTVKLGVVRAHNRAIIANQLFTRVTEVS